MCLPRFFNLRVEVGMERRGEKLACRDYLGKTLDQLVAEVGLIKNVWLSPNTLKKGHF